MKHIFKPGDKVFPTPVGVFLMESRISLPPLSLPHARGGVSGSSKRPRKRNGSSPRPWGCFPRRLRRGLRLAVFPTPVGVFLKLSWKLKMFQCLPHARGGVSKIEESILCWP